MKARTQAAVATLLVAALPLVLVNWLTLRQRQADAAKTADLVLTGNADEVSALLASSRARWLDGVRADARIPGVDRMLNLQDAVDPPTVSRFFQAVASRDPVNINAVGLLDLQGKVVLDSNAVNLGRDESTTPWFRQTLATGQPQLFGPLVPLGDDVPGVFVAALVRDTREQASGVLRIRMEPAVLSQVMASALVASRYLSASLFDEQQRLIAGVGPLGEAPLQLSPSEHSTGQRSFNAADERVAVVQVPNSNWRLVVREPRAVWEAPQKQLLDDWLRQTLLLLVLLIGASMLLGWWIAQPLVRFSAITARLASGDFRPVPAEKGAEETQRLSAGLDHLAARLGETIGSLSRELAQRKEAEAALKTSEAQYLALVERLPGAVYRCANLPGWPMEYLSPQVTALTGYAPEALLGGDGTGFSRLILPEDAVHLRTMPAPESDESRLFEQRYRIQHANGEIRWVWELGAVHAGHAGPGSHLTGVMFDVTRQQTTEQVLTLLRGSIDAQVGGDYFVALATGLVRFADADAVLIGRYRGAPPSEVEALALVDRQGDREVVVFDVEGTPSGALLACGRLDIGDDVTGAFPTDDALRRRGIRSYFGRRLEASDGRPIGVLAVLSTQPRTSDNAVTLALDLIQPRASAELERVLAEERLQHLAETLENRVLERTRELEVANDSLSKAMSQLVQQEKLAALGNLVAGLAHELNTPLGNALTVATALNDSQQQFARTMTDGPLRRSAFDRFLDENRQASDLIERNLMRAASLIGHFKQVAVDQASMRRRTFVLEEIIQEVLSTLSPRLKHLPHRITVNVPNTLILDSFPGPLEQVLTNLIENSLVHAFPHGRGGEMSIEAESGPEAGKVRIHYRDNGVGIPSELQRRVFDPFFTTRLGQGGSGLGMYLAYTLMQSPLGGRIHLVQQPDGGVHFQMDLPAVAPKAPEESLA